MFSENQLKDFASKLYFEIHPLKFDFDSSEVQNKWILMIEKSLNETFDFSKENNIISDIQEFYGLLKNKNSNNFPIQEDDVMKMISFFRKIKDIHQTDELIKSVVFCISFLCERFRPQKLNERDIELCEKLIEMCSFQIIDNAAWHLRKILSQSKLYIENQFRWAKTPYTQDELDRFERESDWGS